MLEVMQPLFRDRENLGDKIDGISKIDGLACLKLAVARNLGLAYCHGTVTDEALQYVYYAVCSLLMVDSREMLFGFVPESHILHLAMYMCIYIYIYILS